MENLTSTALAISTALLCSTSFGCNDDEISSDEAARRAYLGLDKSIEKSITLGFQGFNAATNANIDPQMTTGTKAGTLTITGQVDSGSSANKGMRLNIGLVDYDDGDIVINDKGDAIHVVYNTNTALDQQPYLDMKMMSIPTGTLTGTIDSNANMTGFYTLTGDLKGKLTLNISFTGTLMACTSPCTVLRVPLTTHVTGTATNGDGGVYTIDLMI